MTDWDFTNLPIAYFVTGVILGLFVWGLDTAIDTLKGG